VLQLFLWLTIPSMKAQTVVVGYTDADHPYARSQWTKAEGDAWQKKYGPIIGVNHPEGGYSTMARRACLRKAHELGFNSVRMFLGGSTAANYINTVKSWAADCAAEGMTLSPVFTYANAQFTTGEGEAAALAKVESYLRQVIRAFRGDDRIVLWDLWNEPAMYDDNTPEIMEWIKKMAAWAREEGCTQPLTASIIWDAGNSSATGSDANYLARNAAEAEMDIHNYHDYGVTEDHNGNTKVMVNRLKKIRDCPIVCTECLGRVTGATMARNLVEFAKYHINFYVWGLYASDYNWEVKWGRSTYYAYEPMFHNVLFADGEPYDAKEILWVKNFRFISETSSIDPGAAYTERWDERRAWKWMSREATRGLSYASIDDALTGIAAHASDGLYNSVNVKLSIADYMANATSYRTKFSNLLSAANAAGMNVLATLTSGDDLTKYTASQIQSYAYKFINSFYSDRRVMGWNLYEQTATGVEAQMKSKLVPVMNYTRYSFPNQPIFITPLVSTSNTPDSTATDAVNEMWKISDVIAYNGTTTSLLAQAYADSLAAAYDRPLFMTEAPAVQPYFRNKHINWYATTEPDAATVKNFAFTIDDKMKPSTDDRWPAWKAWQWMNRGVTRGRYYASADAALADIGTLAAGKVYNSIRFQLEYTAYQTDSVAYFQKLDSLVNKAAAYNITLLPALMTDNSVKNNTVSDILGYVSAVVGRYAKNKSIMGWDLYYRPGATYLDKDKVAAIIPQIFAAARANHQIQPLMMTPPLSSKDVGDNYISETTHSNAHGAIGWSKLNYASGCPETTVYSIWCLSDVIAYMSMQAWPEMGMLQTVAYRFARPMFCTEWRYNSSEEASVPLASFSDMHVNWYLSRTVDEDLLKSFSFRPVSTAH
jgi:hypothetical protein